MTADGAEHVRGEGTDPTAARRGGARWWPLGAALGLAAAILGVEAARVLSLCDGQLVYGLDDAYIHMTLARTLAGDGTWGIRAGEFVGVSSSILWPLLLAGVDAAIGAREGTPLALDLLLLVAVLARADSMLAARASLSPAARFAALAALFLCTPMPSMVFDGMEHVLQILVTLELLHRAGRLLARPPGAPGHDLPWLIVLAAVGSAVRYECLFPVAATAILLASQRRWGAAAALSAAGLAPVAVYGAVLASHGWPPLPTGLVLKTALMEPSALEAARRTFNDFAGKVPAAMTLVLAASWALVRFAFASGGTTARAAADRWAGMVLALAVLAHLTLAQLGNLFRYEAYLVAAAVVVLAVPFRHLLADARRRLDAGPGARPRLAALLLAAAVLAFPLAQRSLASLLAVPLASRDIYRQQIQMARFLDGYYPGETVAVNDIGAIAYHTDLAIVDVWGLATREVADLRRVEKFPREALVPVLRAAGVSIALVYAPWIGEEVPASWIEVGTWTVDQKVVLGWHEVTFYATEPAAEERLRDAFLEFRPSLPPGVTARTRDGE